MTYKATLWSICCPDDKFWLLWLKLRQFQSLILFEILKTINISGCLKNHPFLSCRFERHTSCKIVFKENIWDQRELQTKICLFKYELKINNKCYLETKEKKCQKLCYDKVLLLLTFLIFILLSTNARNIEIVEIFQIFIMQKKCIRFFPAIFLNSNIIKAF